MRLILTILPITDKIGTHAPKSSKYISSLPIMQHLAPHYFSTSFRNSAPTRKVRHTTTSHKPRSTPKRVSPASPRPVRHIGPNQKTHNHAQRVSLCGWHNEKVRWGCGWYGAKNHSADGTAQKKIPAAFGMENRRAYCQSERRFAPHALAVTVLAVLLLQKLAV